LSLCGTVLLLAFARRASAQTEIGGAVGSAFGFSQDVTRELRGTDGAPLLVLHDNSVSVGTGWMSQVGMTHWLGSHPAVGVEAAILGWRNSIPVPTWPSLATRRFEQQRTGILGNFVGRVSLANDFRTYLYGGIGGGAVVSRLNGSRGALGPALSLVGGISRRFRSQGWRISLEGRYLITRDFDALVRERGATQNLEFSGHPSNGSARPIFGPHMDSRFLGVLLGIHWTRGAR
jgi:hypothetical protein